MFGGGRAPSLGGHEKKVREWLLSNHLCMYGMEYAIFVLNNYMCGHEMVYNTCGMVDELDQMLHPLDTNYRHSYVNPA